MLRLLRGPSLALAGFVGVVCMVGCNREAATSGYSPEQVRAKAEGYFNQLRNHQLETLKGEIAPGVSAEDETEAKVAKLAAAFPTGTPVAVKLVGYRRLEIPDVVTESTTLEYEFPHVWVEADVTTETRNGDALVTGIHVQQATQSLRERNRFTLREKGIGQYAMLLLWLLAIALTVFAFVVCLRTKMSARKWLWLLFILIGVGQLAVNWTMNVSAFRLIYVQVPPGMATATEYGPWVLSVSLPLGAIVFLAKRRSLEKHAASRNG